MQAKHTQIAYVCATSDEAPCEHVACSREGGMQAKHTSCMRVCHKQRGPLQETPFGALSEGPRSLASLCPTVTLPRGSGWCVAAAQWGLDGG